MILVNTPSFFVTTENCNGDCDALINNTGGDVAVTGQNLAAEHTSLNPNPHNGT